LIEGEGLAQPTITHHLETRGVDERVGTFVVPAQPIPSRDLLILGDAMDHQSTLTFEQVGPIEKSQPGSMIRPANKDCPRFPHDQIRSQDLLGAPETLAQLHRSFMPPVTG
jgi:hypothetical protein